MTNPVHYAFLVDHALGRVQMFVMGVSVREISLDDLGSLAEAGPIMSRPICGKRPPDYSDVCKLAPSHENRVNGDRDRHEGFGGQGWD